MITTDQLFEEPFKPQWMIVKEIIEARDLDESIRAATDFKWNEAARKSRERIIKRFSARKDFHSPAPESTN